jgi:hypothetical protein
MTDRVARLLELYVLLDPATPHGGQGWRAEQMRLLTEMTLTEADTYYRGVQKYRRDHPAYEELVEWP